jgi:hypothetical protein
MVIQIGEDLEEQFERELENCPPMWVRHGSNQRKPKGSLPLVWACEVRRIAVLVFRDTATVRFPLGGIV